MATILTKRSNTASSVPVAGDLTNSTGGAELAVNTADKRLFTKDSGGTVVELGTNPSSVTLPNGTANGVPYLNGSKVLTSGSALTFDGTKLNAASSADGPVSLFGVSNATTGGGSTLNIAAASTQYAFPSVRGDTVLRSESNSLVFGTASEFKWGSTGAEWMRLTSTGLGIGTSSISWKLTLASGSGVVGFMNPAGNSDLAIGSSTNHPVTFWTNSTEKMRLDSSGNLGLGVTPSAWGSNYKAIESQGNSSFAIAGANVNGITIASNAYATNAGWLYKTTGPASYYNPGANGIHQWFTAPSGTAGNAISFTQAMTLTAGGQLLIGATSTGASDAQLVVSNGSNAGLEFSSIAISGENRLLSYNRALSQYAHMNYVAASHKFAIGASEAARIDSSGNLLVGKTSSDAATYGFEARASGVPLVVTNTTSNACFFNRQSDDGAVVNFARGSATVGSVSVTTTATAYNTSSDYRLKENIQPMTGALAKVAALKPCTYKWKADGSEGEGFIAHELAEVVPQCVTGEKDAVDAEGNPVYQGIDTSFLVATLTAAIQELKAEFDAYKASHP